MRNPLVSIVVTTYNYQDYVCDAIDSALNQSYDNIEVIVIDDGSSDNTKSVLDKYSSDRRVTLISRENRGIIYTRNEGVRTAKGEFVMQLDADDILEPSYVKECISKALSEDLDIVYTQTRAFGRVEYISEHGDYNLEQLKHYGYMHATSLVRKSKMKEEPYDPYLDKLGNEDWDMFLDMCMDGSIAGLVNKPLLNYRKHIDRQSRADTFEGLYNEALVRHHVWTKQNAKHPDQFWYFSQSIETLMGLINLIAENEKNIKLKDETQLALDEFKLKYEGRTLIYENTRIYKLLRSLKHRQRR